MMLRDRRTTTAPPFPSEERLIDPGIHNVELLRRWRTELELFVTQARSRIAEIEQAAERIQIAGGTPESEHHEITFGGSDAGGHKAIDSVVEIIDENKTKTTTSDGDEQLEVDATEVRAGYPQRPVDAEDPMNRIAAIKRRLAEQFAQS